MWSHVLYTVFENDVSAIQWCQFCVSLSGSLLNILHLFARLFSQNPKLQQWRTDGINYTGDLPRYVLDRLFDNLTDKSYWNVDDRNNVDFASNIYSREQLKIPTDNRSIFDRVCDVGKWESWGIPEYADDAIRTAI